MEKRAQITMESLLLYGAAILVVLLAIAALMYFDVFSLGDLLPQRCNMEATNAFSCEAYSADSSTGEISLELMNTQTKTIDISAATFVPTDPGMASGCSMSAAVPGITPNSQDVVTIDCTTFNAQTGDRLAGTVQLTYKFSGSSLDMTGQGEVSIAVS